MRYLYTLLFYLTLPFLFIRLWWKGRKTPGYRLRWPERLGFIPALPATSRVIWIHAVSLGEMIAAKPLIQALRTTYPDTQLIITTTTVTGSSLAQQCVGDDVYHCYLPYDLPGPLTRFLTRTHPQQAIIMETELWPNLLHYTAQRQIPILLANARLSSYSLQSYRRIPFLTRPMLSHITCIAAQTQADADRFMQLGAQTAQIKVMGSIKFDISVPMPLVEEGRALRQSWGLEQRPVLIAASTHAQEEDIVLSAFAQCLKSHPNALLILVPRHSERFQTVLADCQKQGYRVVSRTQQQPCTSDTQVFLGDTIGELFLYYAMADIAFVGGSFVPVGGHNPLEPAALGLSVLTGPHIHNFTQIFAWLAEAGAAITVDNATALNDAWKTLLDDADDRKKRGTQGQTIVEANRGALAKHMACMAEMIPSKYSAP
jgi:3-deoxy-D-manno-octulosonic-acid transferase